MNVSLYRYWLFVMVLITMSSCFKFRVSDTKAYQLFGQNQTNFHISRYKMGDSTMRYLEIANDTLPTVVFIHGGLGTALTFKKYLKDTLLQKKYAMIAVDRYGHGYSDFGHTETNVRRQAEMIIPILKKLNLDKKTPTILVGYSFGGTIAARIAMDCPDCVDELILAAPAIDPQNEKKFWFNKPMDWWGFKWFLPQNFIIANDEKLAHASECAKMMPFWGKIVVPTVYIHGKNDGIVPFANYRFARKMLKNESTQYIVKDTLPHVFVEENTMVLRNVILDVDVKSKSFFSKKERQIEQKGNVKMGFDKE